MEDLQLERSELDDDLHRRVRRIRSGANYGAEVRFRAGGWAS